MTIESAKTVQFWDEKGNYLGPMMVQQPGYVNAIAFSPDGDRLAIGNESGTIRCYRIR